MPSTGPFTVRKEGPNQNRRFFSCSRERNDPANCNFFAWVDDESGQPIIEPPRPPRATNGPPCGCQQPTIGCTVRKEGPNQNKQFLTASKNEESGCVPESETSGSRPEKPYSQPK